MHNIPDFLRVPSEMQEHFAKGGMIKRADGSYSRRGLWDNIRANKGSGRKPTKEMLEQEAKIKAEEQYGGLVEEFGNGGYTVRRSHERKGKTHVVIGPDGTKKYFGDSKLGQHPNDPARKKAFYARHKHNLANNPYFRAFARATWEDGGEVPEFAPGGYYSGFFSQEEANRIKRSRTPDPDSMSPSFSMGGLNRYPDGGPLEVTANTGQGINSTWSSSINPMVTTPNITTAGLNDQNQNQFTMDEKQVTTKSPSDDTKMQPGADVTNLLQNSGPLDAFNPGLLVGKALGQLSNAMSSGLAATNIVSRTFGNSNENALVDYNKKQNNPTRYLNQVSNFGGVGYAKDGGTIGQYKEGDEIELTPTQMYLLEKKGYKFQII